MVYRAYKLNTAWIHFCSIKWIAKKVDVPKKGICSIEDIHKHHNSFFSGLKESANLPAEQDDEPIDRMTFIRAAGSNRWIDKSDSFS